ncbi:hypothetical protein I6F15_11625 [Bradyrhizobium sp. BRP14]|nr:hypothetical protein [Bradyrhizobium sp. BRP14]
MNDAGITNYENRLQREIESIDGRIKELIQERNALERQLLKARRLGSGVGEIRRKNSLTRVMVEKIIIDVLETSAKPVSSTTLFREAQRIDIHLKNTTFRTYLHRMKTRGMIQLAGKSGVWKLPAPAARDIFA